MTYKRFPIASLMLAALSACGGGGGDTVPTPTPTPVATTAVPAPTPPAPVPSPVNEATPPAPATVVVAPTPTPAPARPPTLAPAPVPSPFEPAPESPPADACDGVTYSTPQEAQAAAPRDETGRIVAPPPCLERPGVDESQTTLDIWNAICQTVRCMVVKP